MLCSVHDIHPHQILHLPLLTMKIRERESALLHLSLNAQLVIHLKIDGSEEK